MKVLEKGNTRLAFYSVPKVGKTAIKGVMKRTAQPDGRFNNYGDHFFSPRLRWHGRNCYRFTVVRDPLERLVSAYANRIADRDDIRTAPLSVLACKLLGLNPSPGLEEFVLNLNKYFWINDRIFRHVIPQIRYIGKDPGYYNAIYSIRQMSEVAEMLSEQLGETIVIPRSNASISRFSVDDLSEEAKAIAQKFYREDYAIYGDYF